MFFCRRTAHIHMIEPIQLIRMIEWRYRTHANVCPAHTLNIQRPVHMKNGAFKHHVVFQKRLSLLEGNERFTNTNFVALISRSSFSLNNVGVMYHERHTVEHRRYQIHAVAAVEQHPDQ